MNAALEEALTRYVAAYRAGHRPDVEAFCASAGPISEALREAIADFHTFLERTEAGSEASQPALEDRDGQTLGDFRIVREIGRGGMGVVYEAEQLSLRRRVALKVLSAHVTHVREDVERFTREASTAARLRHPGIVEIFAVGEAGGVHFFAMELVDGTPLDRWMPPSIEAACGVVEEVAHALEHAHRAGVVHRDVKPSNVLVTADGRALLTDFGLAREEGLDSLTRTGRFLGTPYYVPPEQAAPGRAPLDHRADVYALGVTLYELLTGRRPFEGANAHEVLAKILVKEPIHPTRLNPRIAVDLATIVSKAMEKDPAKRYPRAVDLAADLRAFLEGRPIAARPVGAPARAVRWARRNPAWATATVLGVLLVVVGPLVVALVATSEQKKTQAALTKANDESIRAKSDFELARAAIDRMLTRVARDRLRAEPRMEALRKEILESALGLYQEFVARHAQNPVARAETARAQQHLAEIHDLLGDNTEAIRLGAEAITTFEQLAREEPGVPSHRRAEAACRRARSGSLGLLGRTAEAEAESTAALALSRRLAEEIPDDWTAARELAESEGAVADVHFKSGKMADASREYETCIDRLGDLAKSHPELQIEVSHFLGKRAWVLLKLGRLGEAERVLHQALAIPTGSSVDERDERASTVFHLAAVLAEGDKLQEALPFHRESVELRQQLADEFPKSARLRHELGVALGNYAATLQGLKDPAWEDISREVLAHFERMKVDFPDTPDGWTSVALCFHNQAYAATQRGEHDVALTHLDRAIENQRRALQLSEKHPAFRATMRMHLVSRARSLIRLGRFDEAEATCMELGSSFDENWEGAGSAARLLGVCLNAMVPEARAAAQARVKEKAFAFLRASIERGLSRADAESKELSYLSDVEGFKELIESLPERP